MDVLIVLLIWGIPVWMLFMMMRDLKKIERKIEHPDERPKHERFWGNRANKR